MSRSIDRMDLDPAKPIIVSHPRSGLNWVRYCIEHATGRPTPGRRQLVEGGDPVIYRTHDVRHALGPETGDCIFYEEMALSGPLRWMRTMLGRPMRPIFSTMVLLLRDYHENAVRRNWRPSRYAANVLAYDAFPGRKHVVYYEDLVQGMDAMKELLSFLGITLPADFDEAEHRNRSLDWYQEEGIGRSSETGTLTLEERHRLQASMRRRIGPCFETLLGRYG